MIRRRRLPVPLSLAALVIGVGGVLAACGSDPVESEAAESPVDCAEVPDADGGIDGVVVEDCGPADHVARPVYADDPPSGGRHLPPPNWLNCGVYDAPVTEGAAVHSLEHGAVWFAYSPDLAADGVAALVELAARNPERVIVSPHPDVDSPVVAVAWERRLAVDDADDPRLAAFLDEFVNGSQAPEPAAACRGGLDA